MGLSQQDWTGLFTLLTTIGLPYILEWAQLSWIRLPCDYFKDNNKKSVPWYCRFVWSAEWYDTMRARVGWWAPHLWIFPFVWAANWAFGTSAVWFVWYNRTNYSQGTWDGFLGMQIAMSILQCAWLSNFLRSRNHFRTAVYSTVMAALALASLGISLYGSFSGDDTQPDGILYIFYASYYVWMACISWTVLLVHWKGGFDGARFQPVFMHTTSGGMYEFPYHGKFVPVGGQRMNMAYNPEESTLRQADSDFDGDSDVYG